MVKCLARYVALFTIGLFLFTTGCHSTSTNTRTYRTQIDSDPPGAYIWSEANGQRDFVDTTPLIFETRYQVKTVEPRHGVIWSSTIGLAALATGGFVMFANADPDSFAEPVGFLGGLLLATFALIVPMAGYLSDENGTHIREVNGPWIHLGPKTNYSPAALRHALPARRFVLTAPGYVERSLTTRLGSSESINMVVDPEGAQALASTSPSRRPESSPGLGETLSATPQPHSYALIVGVEEYRDLPSPTGARQDAESVERMLRETLGVPERNIRTLLDQRATRGDILAQVEWLQNNVPDGARIYFYFSGHGSPNPATGDTYLMPHEATAQALRHTGIDVAELLEELEKTQAREIIAFVDTCFSGAGGRSVLAEGTRPLVPVQEVRAPGRVAFFSASGPLEVSGTNAEGNAGLFTHYLFKGVAQGEADLDGDGQISLAELEAYIAPRVSREARQASREQNPSLIISPTLGTPESTILLWGLSK